MVCQLESNGNFYSGYNSKLSSYDSKFNMIWEKNIHIHHQLNKNSKNELLVMTSEAHGNIRYDNLKIINSNSKILNEFSFFI